MPILTFAGADPVNQAAAGLDCRFTYARDDSVGDHLIYVSARDINWDASEEEKQLYAQYLFAGAVHRIEQVWTERGELPIVIDRTFLVDDFERLGLTPLNWAGYQLTLTK